MKNMTVGKFKAYFSQVLKDVEAGEEIVISFGKNKKKVAVLVPFSKYLKTNSVKLGLLHKKASFKLSKNFKISDEEFLNS